MQLYFSYKSAVTHYSKLLRHNPPLETAVHWIEHVLAFGGAHLRPNIYYLNFFQYHLVDVGVFLFVVVALFIFLVIRGIRICWRKCIYRNYEIYQKRNGNNYDTKQCKLD